MEPHDKSKEWTWKHWRGHFLIGGFSGKVGTDIALPYPFNRAGLSIRGKVPLFGPGV